MTSTSITAAARQVFSLPELMDIILSDASFADIASAMRVCREWYHTVKGTSMPRRFFLTPQSTNKQTAFMLLAPKNTRLRRAGPPSLDVFTNTQLALTSAWDGKTTPQLHPSVAHSQKLCRFDASNGYPAFTVLLFEPKIQDARFIDDMREETSPNMQLSHPSVHAILPFLPSNGKYSRDLLHPDVTGVRLHVYKDLLAQQLSNVPAGQEILGALVIPHHEGWITSMISEDCTEYAAGDTLSDFRRKTFVEITRDVRRLLARLSSVRT